MIQYKTNQTIKYSDYRFNIIFAKFPDIFGWTNNTLSSKVLKFVF
jgi:hypothetical protein